MAIYLSAAAVFLTLVTMVALAMRQWRVDEELEDHDERMAEFERWARDGKLPVPKLPALEEVRAEAVHKLLTGLYLYDSGGRGYGGCVFEALKLLDPEAAALLSERDARTAFAASEKRLGIAEDE